MTIAHYVRIPLGLLNMKAWDVPTVASGPILIGLYTKLIESCGIEATSGHKLILVVDSIIHNSMNLNPQGLHRNV
jgi:hypothetical protein